MVGRMSERGVCVWWGIDLRSRLLVLEGLGLDSLDAHDCSNMCVCVKREDEGGAGGREL